MTDTEKRCFNCKQTEAMNRPIFCDDCWRMAIITSALGASAGEIVHKLLGALLG